MHILIVYHTLRGKKLCFGAVKSFCVLSNLRIFMSMFFILVFTLQLLSKTSIHGAEETVKFSCVVQILYER